MNLINELVEKQIINKEDIDLYEYSLSQTQVYIFFITCVFVVNVFTKEFFATTFFMILFLNLRRYCGGIHLKNQNSCLMLSVCVTCGIPILCKYIYLKYDEIIVIQIIISMIISILPIIDHPNKRLTNNEKKKFKRKAMIQLVYYLLITLLLLLFKQIELGKIVLSAIGVTLISAVVGKIMHQ